MLCHQLCHYLAQCSSCLTSAVPLTAPPRTVIDLTSCSSSADEQWSVMWRCDRYVKWGNMARYSANFTMRFKGWTMGDARQVHTSVRAVVADFAAISVIDVVLHAPALSKEQTLEYNLLVRTDDKDAAGN